MCMAYSRVPSAITFHEDQYFSSLERFTKLLSHENLELYGMLPRSLVLRTPIVLRRSFVLRHFSFPTLRCTSLVLRQVPVCASTVLARPLTVFARNSMVLPRNSTVLARESMGLACKSTGHTRDLMGLAHDLMGLIRVSTVLAQRFILRIT